jgi:uncharacterized surface protein with fasciclin (FAS1) repeats
MNALACAVCDQGTNILAAFRQLTIPVVSDCSHVMMNLVKKLFRTGVALNNPHPTLKIRISPAQRPSVRYSFRLARSGDSGPNIKFFQTRNQTIRRPLDCCSFTNQNQKQRSMNIVETAIQNGSFNTLVAAVKAAGLVDTLTGEGPFTVFAPTDEAFGALPEGTVDTLVQPENKDQLTSILTYHVVAGKVMSGDLSDGMTATTVNGGEITIKIADGKVMINDAEVVIADVDTDNGVIHVINKVIMPA